MAITLLLVAVAAAVQSQLTSVDLVRTADETHIAAGDLQAAMEQVLLVPQGSIPLPGSGFPPGAPIVAFNDLHLRAERVVASYPGYVAGGPIPDPLEIVLELTWSDYVGRQRRLRYASLKTK